MGEGERDFRWVRGVILDLDGTLYSQRKLRWRMFAELCLASLTRGIQAGRVVREFRRTREDLADLFAANAGEQQFSLVAEKLNIPSDVVIGHVREWMFERPLRHLLSARFPGSVEFVEGLRDRGIKVAVFSDYPVVEKLRALQIQPDFGYYSLEEPGGFLKPSPRGLERVVGMLGLKPSECLLIGDRLDRDGACANALGMQFLLCDKSKFFLELVNSHWMRGPISNG